MFLIFFIVFLIGLIALIKGGMPKLKIPNRKVAAIVMVVGLVLAGIAAGGDDNGDVAKGDEEQQQDEENKEDDTSNEAPAESDEATDDDEVVADEPEDETNTISLQGTNLVGDDVEPGIYKSDSINYWARLSGLGGTLDEIITNGNAIGTVYVEIKESDEAFESTGSGEWERIDLDSYEGDQATEMGPGIHLVGKDIQPGRYKTEGPDGYWARLSGLGGELDDIIANENISGSSYVEISSSDMAFQTTVDWVKAD